MCRETHAIYKISLFKPYIEILISPSFIDPLFFLYSLNEENI